MFGGKPPKGTFPRTLGRSMSTQILFMAIPQNNFTPVDIERGTAVMKDSTGLPFVALHTQGVVHRSMQYLGPFHTQDQRPMTVAI